MQSVVVGSVCGAFHGLGDDFGSRVKGGGMLDQRRNKQGPVLHQCLHGALLELFVVVVVVVARRIAVIAARLGTVSSSLETAASSN